MNDKITTTNVMEYMALGKPMVRFDLTEGRCSAQRASPYARKGDALDFAAQIVTLDDSALRAQMGDYGRSRVENELERRHEAPKPLTGGISSAARAVES